MAGARFHFFEQAGFCFFRSQARDFLEPEFFFVQTPDKGVFQLLEVFFLAGKVLFNEQKFLLLLEGIFELFFQLVALFLNLTVFGLYLAFLFFQLLLHGPLGFKDFILALDHDFFLLGERFFARFFHNALGQHSGILYPLAADHLGDEKPKGRAG